MTSRVQYLLRSALAIALLLLLSRLALAQDPVLYTLVLG